MTAWMRKLRALAKLSALGGVVGAVIGVLWVVVSWLLGYSWLNLATLFWGMALCGAMGSLATALLAGATALLESGKTLGNLSVVRAAVTGVVGGAAAPVLVALAMAGTAGLQAQGLLVVAGVGGMLGGALAAGAVASAKRAAAKLRDPTALALEASSPDQS